MDLYVKRKLFLAVLVSGAVSKSSKFTSSQQTDFSRMISVQAFNVSSGANEMMKGLRYFERGSKTTNPEKLPFSWGKVRE